MALPAPAAPGGAPQMPPPPSYNQALSSTTPIPLTTPKHCMLHCTRSRFVLCCVFDNSTRVLAFDPIGSGFLSDPLLTKSIDTFWRRLCRREHIFGCAVREFRPADNNGDGGGRRSADDSGEHRVARRCAVLQLPTGGHQQHRYVLMPHRLRVPLILLAQMEQTPTLSSSIRIMRIRDCAELWIVRLKMAR